ncbi:MAG TPA: ferritin family protein, partial [Syntrophales bacterium]|nr:ferritin family protein [Syntrophales bacterium]
MSSYQGSDIFQFAIRMEENGEKFYNYAASIAKDPKIYGIFTKLAAEEVKHRKLFADMFSRIDTVMPKESYPGEYMAYLQASVDGKVFTAEASKDLADVRDVAAALDFAIGRELDSILYYSEMKKYVTDSAQSLL